MRVRLFGSAVRGENDRFSDLDILVMTTERYDQEQREEKTVELVKRIKELSGIGGLVEEVSISWYSEERLAQMHAEGHLFAWHIFLESVKLLANEEDCIDRLGRPAGYRNSVDDIEKFRRIMVCGQASLADTPRNASYEAGMLYLCCRNIAMCASWHSSGGLKFGRYSPYEVADLPELTLKKEVYFRFAQARIGAARFGDLPEAMPHEVEDGYRTALEWCDNIIASIKSRRGPNGNS